MSETTNPSSLSRRRFAPPPVALVLTLCLAFAQPVRAQLGTNVIVDGATELPAGPLVFQPASLGPRLLSIFEKMKTGETLDFNEYIFYVRALERHPDNLAVLARSQTATRDARLPAKSWALVGSRLHSYYYAADRTLSWGVSRARVHLFLDGSENQGWEDIDLMDVPPPAFIEGEGGVRIKVSHAIAGAAALVMRWDEVRGTVMSHVNTGLGDGVQVAGERILGAWDYAGGVVTRDTEARANARARVANARNLKSPPEVRGNRIGNIARDYLQEHRNGALSNALMYAFARWHTEQEE